MCLCLVLDIRTVTFSKSPCKYPKVIFDSYVPYLWFLDRIYILIPFTNLQCLNFNVIVLFTDLSHTQREIYLSFSNANVSIDLDSTVVEELKRGIVSTGLFYIYYYIYSIPFVKALVYFTGNVNHMHDKNSFLVSFTQWTIAKQSKFKTKVKTFSNLIKETLYN